MSFTERGTCNTIIAYAVGEAVISALIGCFMDWVHPIMLFVAIFGFAVINKIYIVKTISSLQDSKIEVNNPE